MQIRSQFTLGSQPHRVGGLRPSSTPLDTLCHMLLEIASMEKDDLEKKKKKSGEEQCRVSGVWQGVAMDSLKIHLTRHTVPLYALQADHP
jgi:hypothetical protein